MRNILPLLIVLLVLGCTKPGIKLTPVAVDEAAAYPKQEPGTRPPVLTGFAPLSKEQLDQGFVRLFDGVSTYGWTVLEGNTDLSVRSQGGNNVLAWEWKNRENTKIVHAFSRYAIFVEKAGSQGVTVTYGSGYEIMNIQGGDENGSTWNIHWTDSCFAKPQGKPMPLLEADWKPAAGESKAVWTDDVLELTGGLGMVETVKEYGDFVLQLEYRTDKHGTAVTPEGGGVNSGVFFRCVPGETLNGYECQVFNDPPGEDYEKFIGTDTGGIFRRCVGRNVGAKDGQWNYLTIAARGPMIATWVNGIQTVDWTDTRKEDENPRKGLRLKPGTIQLQGHDPGTKIKFRNFRIAELNDENRQTTRLAIPDRSVKKGPS